MCAICETEPIGASPERRAVITPAMKVDATAPSPGNNTPSFPVAGEMLRGSGIRPSCRISPQYTNAARASAVNDSATRTPVRGMRWRTVQARDA
jgi:hypothetical protein